MERRFRLAGLLHLRQVEEEGAAARLAQANHAVREAEDDRDEIAAVLAGAAFPVRGDGSLWQAAVASRASLGALVDEAGMTVTIAARRSELATVDWAEAKTRLAMLDKLAARHAALIRADEDRAEQQVLDEAAARRPGPEEDR